MKRWLFTKTYTRLDFIAIAFAVAAYFYGGLWAFLVVTVLGAVLTVACERIFNPGQEGVRDER